VALRAAPKGHFGQKSRFLFRNRDRRNIYQNYCHDQMKQNEYIYINIRIGLFYLYKKMLTKNIYANGFYATISSLRFFRSDSEEVWRNFWVVCRDNLAPRINSERTSGSRASVSHDARLLHFATTQWNKLSWSIATNRVSWLFVMAKTASWALVRVVKCPGFMVPFYFKRVNSQVVRTFAQKEFEKSICSKSQILLMIWNVSHKSKF